MSSNNICWLTKLLGHSLAIMVTVTMMRELVKKICHYSLPTYVLQQVKGKFKAEEPNSKMQKSIPERFSIKAFLKLDLEISIYGIRTDYAINYKTSWLIPAANYIHFPGSMQEFIFQKICDSQFNG